jgi:hypothetical protein
MTILFKLFLAAKSESKMIYEAALIDLRLLIERKVQNRYSVADDTEYSVLFSDQMLLPVRLTDDELDAARYFAFFMLFNYYDRSIFTAKCIKSFLDRNIRQAICVGIYFYLKRSDETTCELIYAITDVGDDEEILTNEIVKDCFDYVIEAGGQMSVIAVQNLYNYFTRYGLST